jgi:hypothetical protein
VDVEEEFFPFDKKVKDVLNLENCCVRYKEYAPVKALSLGKRPGILPKEYIKRHNYDVESVRRVEDYLVKENKKGLLRYILGWLFPNQ